MRLHKFKNDPEELLKKGQEIINSSPQNKFILRVTMVNLMLSSNLSSLELSRLSGNPQRTLNTGLNTVYELGFDKLMAVKQDGRPAKLDETQLKAVKDAISRDPGLEGFKAWDGKSLAEHIRKKFDVGMGIRQCQRMLKRFKSSSEKGLS